jgi:hypothetical protein
MPPKKAKKPQPRKLSGARVEVVAHTEDGRTIPLVPFKRVSYQEPVVPPDYAPRTLSQLDALAAKLKAGASYEDLQDDVDDLLGTGMEERDREAEAIWEKSRR